VGYLADGFAEALRLIARMDPEVWGITLVSLKVSAASTLIATILGVPIGFSVASREFRGKGFVITVLNTLLALPTVVVGLSVYAFLSRRGPLGSLGLLFTPAAMVIGQSILALPITAALSLAAVQHLDPRVRETALTLGATAGQAARAVLREGRFAILAAVIAAFGRVFAEVGVSMMLGGNIRFYTRNIPTAIALETGRGEFPLAIALGLILLAVAFGVNLVFQCLQRR
jgi:tungstate transport system permease protein